ncbi:hypothetical protein IEN85_22145 [Pelagicoccus sp. NFK12]|uniref:Haemolysin activator HlyB C-terminal domain-containing protein n=1 Tax=Pelagicoccus enzymogenes TaxID=2773457 RepID=A0A927FD68_9BACT|nr:ShlB/FhaC/HecB family hemolysin secretion/activation protein [Pelagicoccus enzymogenes]MBD5782216.1 hypothetical protein [Pelagicoccus enzymogenes]
MRKFLTSLCFLGASVAATAASIRFEGNSSIDTADLLAIRVPLGQEKGAFVLDPQGVPISLDKMMPEYLSEDAVNAILRAVTAYYNAEGFGGARADVTSKAYKAAQSGADLVIHVTERTIHQKSSSIQIIGNRAIPVSELMHISVPLALKKGQYVPDPNGIPITLDKIMPEYLSPSAIEAILNELSRYYQDEGQLAVRSDVTRSSYESSQGGGNLLISVSEGQLASSRVVAMNPEKEVSARVKQRILKAAPLEENDTIDGKKLDTTLGQLNRFSPDYVQPVLMRNAAGDLEMEYRVKTGERAGIEYTLDNYGSERTGEHRHTVRGNLNRILTSADKVELAATYSENDDDDSLFVRGEYLFPLDEVARNRLRFSGYYSEYNSGDIGVQLFEYKGKSASASAAFERTLWTRDGIYWDLSAGGQYTKAQQDHSSLGIPVQTVDFENYFAGMQLSKSQVDKSWMLGGKIEAGSTDANDIELARMGRLYAESDYVIGSLYAGTRLYLDSLWGTKRRRAHEFTATASAKTNLQGDRLPATYLSVLGGHSTVRGYPVASASGDSMIFGQFDYRLHLNRLGEPVDEADQKRHWKPRFEGDIPPLDLALGFFTDVGGISNYDKLFFESDAELWSVGLGLYGKASRQINFSLEYARALLDVNASSQPVESGDDQFYFSIDLNY